MGEKIQSQDVEERISASSDAPTKHDPSMSAELASDSHHAGELGGNSSLPTLQSSQSSFHHTDPMQYNQPSLSPMYHPQSPSHNYPYNMTGMAATLPEYAQHGQQNYPRHGSSRQTVGPSPPQLVYPVQQNMGYAPQQVAYGSPSQYGAYPQQYPSPYGQSPGGSPLVGYGSPYSSSQPRLQGLSPSQYQQASVPYYYYPDPYAQGTSPTGFSPQAAQYPPTVRSGAPAPVSSHGGESGRVYGMPYIRTASGEEISATRSQESATAAIPRGPPRKPKQSGHALWVGNLPPGASIIALKDHFSRDAKRDIESLFLISKSNCAFVNYRSEQACDKAVARFHDSRFQGVRLVCRLRKSSSSVPGVPTGPSSMSGGKSLNLSSSESRSKSPSKSPTEKDESDDEDTGTETEPEKESPKPERVAERYFIVKSLTLQDLDQSVRNGIWATQSHNEIALNKAYNSADNVYLVFSANKSGEYFGYARMASPIAENAAEVYGAVPRTDVSETTDTPKTISTPATEFAPKGHIIDDSARGTIFWEAEHSDDESAEDDVSEHGDPESDPPTWGKPFRVEWISTNRLPFYRTRGLRNPWNANREVKIARDGTELEPGVGAKLLQLFQRPGSIAQPGAGFSHQ